MARGSSDLGDAIRAKAQDLGFDAVGFTRADIDDESGNRLVEFVGLGRHGDMVWMDSTLDRRLHPRALWAGARSIVVVAQSYAQGGDSLEGLKHTDRGNVSVHARGRDYHDVLKKKLKQLARWLVEEQPCEVKVFVDTAPVMEKPLAARAGIGWQGKHTNLVSRSLGSWFFLGSLFTTLDLEDLAPHKDRCGSCRQCLDICPTNAFPAPYQLDARRCISYLTIEHKGHIPVEFRSAIGNRIYGCDDCLAICPWNKFAQQARDRRLHAREELIAPKLTDLLSLSDSGFRKLFSGSPVKRTGRNRFLRNVLIAAGNSGDRTLAHQVRSHLRDPSPLVRAMAVWALSRLLSESEFARLRARHACDERDADVAIEWSTAPSGPNADQKFAGRDCM